MTNINEPVRIDKWLWAVRIFKTRTLAADECRKGRVVINGNTVKPSYIVKIGEEVLVKKPPVIHTFKVKGLLDKRGSAAVAKDYVEDLTPDSEVLKRQVSRLASNLQRDPGAGRPTKKDRRDIDTLLNEW
jgi:ribosome-associated heat shock protein Hsp15